MARHSDRVAGWGAILLAINVVAIVWLAGSEYLEAALPLLNDFWVLAGVVVGGIGGGYVIASKGSNSGSLAYSLVGVAMAQAGFTIIGGIVMSGVPQDERVVVAGGAIAGTTFIVGALGSIVLGSSRSFERWRRYAFGLWSGGLAIWFVGGILEIPITLYGLALVPLGFLVLLVYKVWTVRTNSYSNSFQAAVGVYFAVMAFFLYVVYWIASLVIDLET